MAPTGYTAAIEDHDGCTFEEYVWSCARAFGALVHMRDDSHDAAIVPRKVEDYYPKRIEALRTELAELEACSNEDIEARQSAAIATAEAAAIVAKREREVSRERYQQMRSRVADWEPPTPEHVELKKFMLQQIDLCLPDFEERDRPYERVPARMSPSAYRAQCIANVTSSLAYAEKNLGEERERVGKSNKWVADLEQSVGAPPKASPR